MTEFTTDVKVGKQLGGDAMPIAPQLLVDVVAAVNAYVSGLPDQLDADGKPTETAQLGATMLAARWWRRRNSPGGIEALTDTGAAYVARTDPDIARLLQIDGFRRPQVG